MISRRAVLALAPACLLVLPRAADALQLNVMTPVADLEWSYLADTVMGGVSQGQARMEGGAIRLTGTVSTENRGGFIQTRTALPDGLPSGTSALRLRVRGNGERYFIHLRTSRTRLPWQYYQASFPTSADWADVTLPLAQFEASGRLMRARIAPDEIRSIGLVAYGRDHQADVSLSELGAA